MSKSVKFICRRSPDDKLLVDVLNIDDRLGQELYIRVETGGQWKGSVVLNAVQAVELARRITEQFGAASAVEGKLWEDV